MVGRSVDQFLIWIGCCKCGKNCYDSITSPYRQIAPSVIRGQCLEEHTCTVQSVCAFVILFHFFSLQHLFVVCIYKCVSMHHIKMLLKLHLLYFLGLHALIGLASSKTWWTVWFHILFISHAVTLMHDFVTYGLPFHLFSKIVGYTLLGKFYPG